MSFVKGPWFSLGGDDDAVSELDKTLLNSCADAKSKRQSRANRCFIAVVVEGYVLLSYERMLCGY